MASLALRSGAVVADCTVGQGGHSALILGAIGPDGFLVGLDRDPEALRRAADRLEKFSGRFILVNENFNRLEMVLTEQGITGVDGILMDLGISSLQLGDPGRGFSFQADGPLDMRMDPRSGPSASDLVNSFSEADLVKIFFQYGEERWAKRIARGIIRSRAERPIGTTGELARIVSEAVPANYRYRKIHPATKTFQALRIVVNQEIQDLEGSLQSAASRLNPGGRLAVISFHSLEDRIVKHTFVRLAAEAEKSYRRITKKPVIASGDEVAANPRSRSAKLRVLERARQGDEKSKGGKR